MVLVVITSLALSVSNVWRAEAREPDAQDSRPTATVTGSVVNVRSGPGTGYIIIGQVRSGAVLTVTGRNQAGDWWQICCVNGQTGWISGQLVRITGATTNVPVATSPPSPAPQPPAPSPEGWRGEYFANRNLEGSPAFVRNDPQINFRWGGGSPGGNVPGQNFSVRWTRTVPFSAADWEFFAQVDDGVRVYLDNILLINQWQEHSIAIYSNVFRGLGAGNHRITVEYFQAGGGSIALFWWAQANQFPEWKGEYFNDIYLQGQPLLVRNDPNLNFNWGLDSPDSRVPTDNFSVRWTRRLYFESGNYDFHANTSDGVRVYIDGLRVIDEWHDTVSGVPTYTGRFYDMLAGTHTMVVEYYERGGIAYANVYWTTLRKNLPE
jgi:uncharacterized protein YgiM (DUF1202 family)